MRHVPFEFDSALVGVWCFQLHRLRRVVSRCSNRHRLPWRGRDGCLPSNQRMSIDFFNTMGGTTIEIGTEPSSLGGDNDPISAGYFGSIGGAASDPVMTPPGMGLPLVGIETQTTCMPAMKTVFVDPHGNQVGPNYAHAVATSVPAPIRSFVTSTRQLSGSTRLPGIHRRLASPDWWTSKLRR